MVSGNLLNQPPLHPVALHNDNLRRKRFPERLVQNLPELAGENLKAVTGVERKTSGHTYILRSDAAFAREKLPVGSARNFFANHRRRFRIGDAFPIVSPHSCHGNDYWSRPRLCRRRNVAVQQSAAPAA